jgi:hypothetical protein
MCLGTYPDCKSRSYCIHRSRRGKYRSHNPSRTCLLDMFAEARMCSGRFAQTARWAARARDRHRCRTLRGLHRYFQTLMWAGPGSGTGTYRMSGRRYFRRRRWAESESGNRQWPPDSAGLGKSSVARRNVCRDRSHLPHRTWLVDSQKCPIITVPLDDVKIKIIECQ